MKSIFVVIFLLAVFISLLACAINIMPVWQWMLPSIVLLAIVGALWNWSKTIAVIAGVVLGAVLLCISATPTDKKAIVVNHHHHTYVVYNNCFLYCNPIVYKKIPYLPFTKYHQRLGEQAIISYRVEGDTIYLEDKWRTWLLIE